MGEAETTPGDRGADGELEAHLDDALRRAKAQLSHIRGNLALVATFLSRSEP